MRFLLLVKRVLDKMLDLLVIGVFGFLVVIVSWQVVSRFILRDPSDWTEELATFLMIWVGLLGASVALRLRAHLGIDVFVKKLPEKARAVTDVFGYAAVAAFSIAVLMIGGGQLVREVWVHGQTSPALNLPMAWVYAALPVSGFFLTLYSLVLLYEKIVSEWMGKPVEKEAGLRNKLE